MLSHDKGLIAEFQAIFDQSAASWWAPEPLRARARQSTTGIFGHHAPASTDASLAQAA